MWEDDILEEEKRKKKNKQIVSTSPQNQGMFGGFFTKFFGNSEKHEKGTITKVHGATYSLPVNENIIKPEDIQPGQSKTELATKKDKMENRYSIDEQKLLETISQVSKSIKKTEVVGTLNGNNPKEKPKFEKKIPTKLVVDNLKPIVEVDNNQSPTTKGVYNLNVNSSLKELKNIGESKVKELKNLLQQDDLDMQKFTKLCWSGLPQEVRSIAWKILTGYVPTNKQRREASLQRKRKEYLDLVDKYYDEKSIKKSEQENVQLRQIHIDVPRTNPDLDLYQQQLIQDSLERILYIWSIRHPASGYVQGINDLVTPFLTIFLSDYVECDVFKCDVSQIEDKKFKEIESDTFWCFSLFMDFIQDHYTFAQPGIQKMVQKLENIIEKIDHELYAHMKKEKLDFMHFSFRWMNCLLMRELPLKLIIRIFDTYLSEGDTFSTLHVYVCASFLKTWSSKLKNMEYGEMIMFVQRVPTMDWTLNEVETLLSQAYMLKTLYNNNTHLNN